jgi:Xaa-Pro aminopeptidase
MRLRAIILSFWFLFILTIAYPFSQFNLECYGRDHKGMNPHPADNECKTLEVFSDNGLARIEPPRKNAPIFENRRKKLLSQIEEGIALINSSGVSFDPPALCKNLEYLTGLESPQAWLILAPQGITVEGISHGYPWATDKGSELGRGREVQEALFVPEPSERQKMYNVPWPTIGQIRESTGIEAVYGLSAMNDVLENAFFNETVLWLNTSTSPKLNENLTPEIAKISEIKRRFYWLQLKNIAPLIHEMRRVKDSYEIACLRTAYEITTEIIVKIMRTIKPGDNESLVHAIFDYELESKVNSGVYSDLAKSFETIVAAGRNTSIISYRAANQEIRDGDLILIDAGVAYNGYCADITRVWPANGRFTPRQRELYSIVLEAQKRGIATMKPGATSVDVRAQAYNLYKEHNLLRWAFGRNCHPLGLNVHDRPGLDRYRPFKPGVALVFEPLLMIQDEGIGIRIEDGVLINETGHEVLPGPPKEIEEIEALCSKK